MANFLQIISLLKQIYFQFLVHHVQKRKISILKKVKSLNPAERFLFFDCYKDPKPVLVVSIKELFKQVLINKSGKKAVITI